MQPTQYSRFGSAPSEGVRKAVNQWELWSFDLLEDKLSVDSIMIMRACRVCLDLSINPASWLKSWDCSRLTANETSSRVDPLFSSNWSIVDWISSRLPSKSFSILQKVLVSSTNFNHNLQISLALTTSFVSKFLKVLGIVSEGRTSLMYLRCDRVRISEERDDLDTWVRDTCWEGEKRGIDKENKDEWARESSIFRDPSKWIEAHLFTPRKKREQGGIR